MRKCTCCGKEKDTIDFCDQTCKRRYYRGTSVPTGVQELPNTVPVEVQEEEHVPDEVHEKDSEIRWVSMYPQCPTCGRDGIEPEEGMSFCKKCQRQFKVL